MRALGRGSDMSIASPVPVGVITQTSHSHISPSTPQRLTKFISSTPCLIKFTFLISLLVEVLQLAYQNKAASPFDTHPANMWASIIATFVYCIALAATTGLQPDTSHSALAGYVTFFAGALSSISIVSIFLPRWLECLIFIMWFILLAMVGWVLYGHLLQRLYQLTKEKLHNRWIKFVGHNSTEKQPAPA